MEYYCKVSSYGALLNKFGRSQPDYDLDRRRMSYGLMEFRRKPFIKSSRINSIRTY